LSALASDDFLVNASLHSQFACIFASDLDHNPMMNPIKTISRLINSAPVVPVVRLTGVIGAATPLRQGLSIVSVAPALERAFSLADDAVAIQVNSPGGSAVQSRLIFQRIRDLAREKNVRVYMFAEDVAASGGYMLLCAGDEIYADSSSIIGSIGVIFASFGFVGLIDKIGVERRVHTSQHPRRFHCACPRPARETHRGGRRTIVHRRILERAASA